MSEPTETATPIAELGEGDVVAYKRARFDRHPTKGIVKTIELERQRVNLTSGVILRQNDWIRLCKRKTDRITTEEFCRLNRPNPWRHELEKSLVISNKPSTSPKIAQSSITVTTNNRVCACCGEPLISNRNNVQWCKLCRPAVKRWMAACVYARKMNRPEPLPPKRRDWSAANHTEHSKGAAPPIGICECCKEPFDVKHHNTRYCIQCRPAMIRWHTAKQWAIKRNKPIPLKPHRRDWSAAKHARYAKKDQKIIQQSKLCRCCKEEPIASPRATDCEACKPTIHRWYSLCTTLRKKGLPTPLRPTFRAWTTADAVYPTTTDSDSVNTQVQAAVKKICDTDTSSKDADNAPPPDDHTLDNIFDSIHDTLTDTIRSITDLQSQLLILRTAMKIDPPSTSKNNNAS